MNTKTEAKHTPTPWKTYHENGSMGSGGHWGIETDREKDTMTIATVPNRLNAAFIVRAVNAHEDLMIHSRRLMEDVESLIARVHGGYTITRDEVNSLFMEDYEGMKAAIRKAEEGV